MLRDNILYIRQYKKRVVYFIVVSYTDNNNDVLKNQ